MGRTERAHRGGLKVTTTPTSKPHITNARILLGLDGFGPVTIEDWRSFHGYAPTARAAIRAASAAIRGTT